MKCPLRFARFRVERAQQARQVVEVAGDTHNYVISDYQRRIGGPETLGPIGDDGIPFDLTVPCVQCDEVAIGSGEKYRVLEDGSAPVSDVKGVVLGVHVMPQF